MSSIALILRLIGTCCCCIGRGPKYILTSGGDLNDDILGKCDPAKHLMNDDEFYKPLD